jgi:hypothetical protein
MTVYYYDPISFVYTSTGEIEGGAVPANATTIAPGTPTANIAYVWHTNHWITMPDYRGSIYSITDGSFTIYSRVGPLPSGFTNLAPGDSPNVPTNYNFSGGGGWVFNAGAAAAFQAVLLRERRNSLIASTDWVQADDIPSTPASLQAFATYRQYLRDITTQSSFPDSVTWPAKPTYVKQANVENTVSKQTSIQAGYNYAITNPIT